MSETEIDTPSEETVVEPENAFATDRVDDGEEPSPSIETKPTEYEIVHDCIGRGQYKGDVLTATDPEVIDRLLNLGAIKIKE